VAADAGSDLRMQVLTSLKWTVGTRIFVQLVSWGVTIFVMRLLSPADYGLAAMAVVITGFLELVKEMGLSASIVQAKSIDRDQLKRIFGAVLLANAALCLLVGLGISAAAARFYGEPQIEPILQVLAFTFPIGALGVIPGALLERGMRFRERSIAEFSSMMVTSFAVLGLAWSGWGVWALVAGNVLQVACRTAALNFMRPFFCAPSFRFDRADALFIFGKDVFVARLLWFFYTQADIFIAGKLLGKQALGLYGVAMHFAALPVDRISVIVNQLALAAFSQSGRADGQVGRHVLKAVRTMSLVAFPVLWGVSSVSAELIAVVLGPTWMPAAPLIALLCLIMPLRMLGEVLKSALQSIDHARVAVRNTLLAALVMPPAFYIGCQFGLIGLVLAWLAVYPLIFLQNVGSSAPHLGISFGEVVRAMARPAAAGAGMYAAVSAARVALGLGPLQALCALVAVGMLSYAAISLIVNRAGLAEMWDLVAAGRK
jgi:O-antigen/teichoic acid export membrane protein